MPPARCWSAAGSGSQVRPVVSGSERYQFPAMSSVCPMIVTPRNAWNWYRSLPETTGVTWLPDPAADQHLAGGILWASGDVIGLVFLSVLFTQWVRASMKEAAREDRRLDRLERSGG